MIIVSANADNDSNSKSSQNRDNNLMIIKSQLLLESARISDIGMEAARSMLERAFTENITEADVAEAAATAMVENGSSEYVEAFKVIVASGEQSAMPHGDPSDDDVNRILPGEVVVVDLGARYRGYCTDLTRTFFMGEPTHEMMKVYNIVMEAQYAAINAVRSGALAREVDKIARDIITAYGYGDNFTHGLGHGIGLYIHMPPFLYPESKGILMERGDMTITIEPGIYLTGNFGVRLEDDVFVLRRGYEVITHYPKGLDSAIIYPPPSMNETVLTIKPVTIYTRSDYDYYYLIVIGTVIIALPILAWLRTKKLSAKHTTGTNSI
jgi:Xaa-Pro aminopeptidase